MHHGSAGNASLYYYRYYNGKSKLPCCNDILQTMLKSVTRKPYALLKHDTFIPMGMHFIDKHNTKCKVQLKGSHEEMP